jgi:hypothetical protein
VRSAGRTSAGTERRPEGWIERRPDRTGARIRPNYRRRRHDLALDFDDRFDRPTAAAGIVDHDELKAVSSGWQPGIDRDRRLGRLDRLVQREPRHADLSR